MKKKLKKKYFKLQCKKLFLTFPKNDMDKEELLEKLVRLMENKDNEFIIVCQEEHKDKTEHLHAVVVNNIKGSYSNSVLDKLTGKHGNYQSCRSVIKCVEYVKKTGNFICHPMSFSLDKWLKEKKSNKGKKADICAQMINDGKSLREIDKDYPGYVMIHLKKLKEYQTWKKIEQLEKKKKFLGFKKNEEYTHAEKSIVDWFEKNVIQKRKWDDKHLFIYGNTQMGKTTFIKSLDEFFNIYYVPMDEDFYDFYKDSYDLVVFEEFKSQKRIQWLNRFLDGQVMTLRVKGSQILKGKAMPCIFLSNYELKDCYPKVYDKRYNVFQTLERRLKIIQIDRFLRCHPIGTTIEIYKNGSKKQTREEKNQLVDISTISIREEEHDASKEEEIVSKNDDKKGNSEIIIPELLSDDE